MQRIRFLIYAVGLALALLLPLWARRDGLATEPLSIAADPAWRFTRCGRHIRKR